MFRGRRSSPRPTSPRYLPLQLVTGGALQTIADTILQPVLLLAAAAFLLGGSNTQIAGFAVASVVAWSAMPLVLTLVRSLSSRMAAFSWIGLLIRISGAGAVAWAALHLDDWSPSRSLEMLLSAFIVYQVGRAMQAQSSASSGLGLLAQTQNLELLRWRNVAMAIASLLSAWLVLRVFSSDIATQNAWRGVLLMAVLATLAAAWFALLVLFGRPTRSSLVSPTRVAGSMRSALGNSAVRRLVGYKFLLAAVAAFDPFLIVLGFRNLDMGIRYIGWALIAWAAGQVIGSVLWPRWIARSGARIPFQLTAFFRLLLLVWVVTLPTLVESTVYTDRFDSPTAAMRGFAVSFVLLGLAGSAGTAGNLSYLVRATSASGLSGATMVTNLVGVVGGLLPLAVAWGLDRYDDDRVYWVAIGLAVVALLASGTLANAGTRVRRRNGSWRHESRPGMV